MKRIFYLMLGMACMLASCSREKEETEAVITDFPIEETLQGERINLELPEYLSNMMGLAGDYYVFNAIRASYCFQVYDKDFNLVDTVGRMGGGPNEIQGGALFLGQWEGASDSPKILAYASDSRKLVKLAAKGDAELETVVKINIMKMPELYPKFFYKAGADSYYGMNLGYSASASVFSYDAATEEIKMGSPAFEINKALSPMYATQQSMAIDPDNKRICAAYMSYPLFAIYDSDLNVAKRFFVGEKFDTETVASDSNYSGMIGVQFYNGKILMLYAPNDKDHSLLVFSGKGEPLASYGVGDAIGYAIDGERNRLLTTNYDNEEDIVYLMKYDLPKEI